MSNVTRLLAFVSALALVGAFVIAAPRSLNAQDDATPEVQSQVGGYFVAIHEGTCEEPVAASSWDVGEAHLPGVDDDQDEGEMRGSTDAVPVLIVDETVGTDFGNVLDDGQYLIAVHESAENFGNIVACGALGGVVDDGRLVIGLEEVGGSGVQGVAVIDEDSGGILGLGDDELSIKVYLLTSEVMGAETETDAAAAATPVAGAAEDDMDDAAATVEAGADEGAATVEAGADEAADEAGDAADEVEDEVEEQT
jgi:hypothetical protein